MATTIRTSRDRPAAGGKPRRRRGPRILVAGLGNLLLTDDGVGIHAVRELRRRVPRGVRVADIGTAVLDALHLFEEADKVLAIDAVQAGGSPGEIYVFRVEEAENRPSIVSLHDFGLRSVLEFMGNHRPEIVVLGVEPEKIDYGLTLSASVQSALARLVQEATAILLRWTSAGSASADPQPGPCAIL